LAKPLRVVFDRNSSLITIVQLIDLVMEKAVMNCFSSLLGKEK